MNIDNIIADFQFLSHRITESNLKIFLLDYTNKKIEINYDIDYKVLDYNTINKLHFGTLEFSTKLTGEIDNEPAFNIDVKIIGKFMGSIECIDSKHFLNMLELNGAATLSQIMRSYILTISSLSGLPQINLPMINIHLLKKDKSIN